MATQITTVGSDTDPGIHANSRRIGRTKNGTLWALLSDTTASRLEFWYSTNNGGSWSERTGLRINNVRISSGASMRIVTDGSGSERIAVIYHSTAHGNHMMAAMGYFTTSSQTDFNWHPGSPKEASKGRSSADYRNPDITGFRDGNNWLLPSVWGERYSNGKGLVWMGRNRAFPNEMYADDASAIHEQFNVSNVPTPSSALRHLSDLSAVYTSLPDLYVSWGQGVDTDPKDARYMMRLTKSGTTWQTGTVRKVVNDGVFSGLSASCYTGQRAAFAAVGQGSSAEIDVSLMQPSDSSRETIQAPSLGRGEITALSITWDNYTSDLWLVAVGTTNRRPYYVRYDWQTRSWGTWTEINTDAVMPDSLTTKPGSAGSRIECLYAVDLGTSLAFKYELVGLTNVAPAAPTWNLQSGAHDVLSPLVLDWDFNDADGDAQAQYKLRRQVDGGSYTYWNGTGWQSTSINLSSASTTVTLNTGWGADGSTYEYVVSTSDGQKWSVNSATLTALASTPSNPSITAPAASEVIDEPNVTVTWTVGEQAAWRLRLLNQSTGVQEHTTGWRGEASTREYQIPFGLTDGASYTIELTTQNNEGLASTPQTVNVSVALTQAPTPVITLSVQEGPGTITVDINNGTPGVGEVAAVANNVWRRDLDDPAAVPVLVGGPVAVNGSFSDRTVRSGRNYSYAVDAITEAGAATMSLYVEDVIVPPDSFFVGATSSSKTAARGELTMDWGLQGTAASASASVGAAGLVRGVAASASSASAMSGTLAVSETLISAVPAAASAEMPAPTVTAAVGGDGFGEQGFGEGGFGGGAVSGGVTVTAVAATATADMPAGGAVVVEPEVPAVVAAATGDAPAPIVTTGVDVTTGIGVNLAGAEGGEVVPGVAETNYHHTTSQAAWNQITARLGADALVRYPILWERLQRTLGGALDAYEVPRITSALDAAATAGAQVILDVHNYARYQPFYRDSVIVDDGLDAAKASAIATAGFTHVTLFAFWDRIKTGGTGSAVDAAQVTALRNEIAAATGAGLKVVLEPALQYPPGAVKTAVPKFKQQDGTEWTGGIGDDIRDWVWTQTGRDAVQDFLDDLFTELAAELDDIAVVRVGGLNFGELAFPSGGTDSDPHWWGFSDPAQTGTGLATGMTVCPVPGHNPSPTGAWTANDATFANWYLDSVSNWMLWLISRVQTHLPDTEIAVMHPGFGLRDNYDPAETVDTWKADGWRRQAADGVDWARQMDAYKSVDNVWPWSTWGDGADPFPGGSVDSDLAAYKSLWNKAAVRTRDGIPLTTNAWAENTGIHQTGNTITTDIDNFYGVRARPYGYQNLNVFKWADLTAGAGEGVTAVEPYLAATLTQLVNGDDLPDVMLADLWRRIVARWGAHAAVIGYGIMNEPRDLPGVGEAGFVTELAVNTYDGGAGPDRQGGAGGSFDSSKTGTGEDVIGGNAADLTGRTHAGVWVRVDAGSDTTTARLGVRDAAFANQNITSDTPIPADGAWHHIYGPIPAAQQGAGDGVAHRDFTLFIGGGAGAKTIYVDDLEAGSEGGGAMTGTEYWEQTTQTVVDAIRETDAATTILVPLDGWSGAHQAQNNHPGGPWIVNGGPIRYEAHNYWDRDNSGDYPDTYAAEVTDAQNRGYTAGANADALHTRVLTELGVFTTWLGTADGFIGEFGWPWDVDSASWNALADVWFAQAVTTEGLWVTQWAAGEWWGGYNLGIYVDGDLTVVRASATPIEALDDGGAGLGAQELGTSALGG